MPPPETHHTPPIITIGAVTIRVLVRSADTNGQLETMEFTAPEGAPSPRLHVHQRADETFHVLEGVVEFTVRSERVSASAGRTVHVPRGTPHAFRYTGPGTNRMLVSFTPAIPLESYFQELAALVRNGPPHPVRMSQLMTQYDSLPATP